MYCGYCLVFAKSGCFSTSGYIEWKNAVGDKRGNFKKHEQCKQHQDAQQQATEFLRVCDSKERKDVYSFLSTAYKEKIERNRKILLSIVDVIVTLGKRNIGLRGSWDKVKKKEDGNFQFFVDWKAVFDQDLKHDIEKGARNAQYISPTTQNELIACCEAEIRDSIIEKCKEAPLFSLCADETTDVSVTEQLSLCVRYIDQSTMEVCEDLLGYMRLEKCDAKSIAGVITETLQKWTLNIEKLRGLGFDGASVMSGANTGGASKTSRNSATCNICSLSITSTKSCSCKQLPKSTSCKEFNGLRWTDDMVCDSFSKAKSNSQTKFEW